MKILSKKEWKNRTTIKSDFQKLSFLLCGVKASMQNKTEKE